MKSFLDHNAIFLVNVRLPREVRCYCCKASHEEASLYLNHNSNYMMMYQFENLLFIEQLVWFMLQIL